MARQLAGAVLMACFSWQAVAWSAGDEESVERVITDAAKATASFSDTGDAEAVLKVYAKDYTGVQDGEQDTRDTIEKWLEDYEAELKRGSTLRFISSVSNVKTGLTGSIAWTTYDYLFQAIRNGELEGQDVGKCTSLLRKEGGAWLIFHEHCSKTRTGRGK